MQDNIAADLVASLANPAAAEDSVRVPTGIPVSAFDTGADGARLVIVHGECFGQRIEWFDEVEETVTISTDPATGLPMLSYPVGVRDLRVEYRGLEANGLTWWRYAHEVDPKQYREHCLRIVRRV